MTKPTLALWSIYFCTSLLGAASLSPESKEVSLTLYNSQIALVDETKELTLYKDEKYIRYKEIAKEIDLSSIQLKTPKELVVHSLILENSLPTQEQLLQANLGKKVEIRRQKSAYEYEILPATLLSYDHKRAMVQTIAKQIMSVKNSSLIFDAPAKAIELKPSLLWSVTTHEDIKTDISLEYLTRGISFEPHYALYVEDNSSQLIASVMITNNSGSDFEDANISLVAGEINRLQEVSPQFHKSVRAVALASSSDQRLEPKLVEGYYLYRLPQRLSLANRQTKRVPLFEKENIKTQRKYIAKMSNPLYLRGEEQRSVSSYLMLEAIDEPLLSAKLRSYTREGSSSIFLGESRLKATPKGESAEILLGENFDLSVTQTLLKRHESKESTTADVLYTLTNSSAEPKEITLLIAFNKKSGSIVKSDKDYSYTKGNFVTFKIHLTPESSEKFNVHFESEK